MNKITLCSYPDYLESNESYGLKNYDNIVIKEILNKIDHDAVFFLIDQHVPNEWLNKVTKQVNILFDCDSITVDQIKTVCQKKKL